MTNRRSHSKGRGGTDMSGRRRRTVPASGSRASSPRLMITQDPGGPGRARVIGSLTGDAFQILRDAVDSGVAVLDLAEVVQVDDPACTVIALNRRHRRPIVTPPP